MQKKWMRMLCAALALGLCLGGAAEETLSSERVLEIERALYSLGYHDESFDALLDDVTRKALRSFQKANGLTPTGEADAATLQLLDFGLGVTCHQYLVSLRTEYEDAPILQSGSAGEAVSSLQRRLKELGYFSGDCDGMFGEATLAAVELFQMANGLSETGAADRSTQFRLNEGTPMSWQAFLESSVAVFGDEGLHVRQLQRKLKELGYFSGDCTGKYGELTQQAVSSFQENNDLEKNGMADLGTCTVLYTGAGVPLKDPNTLRQGDDSETVAELQRKLAEHGYFDKSITGVFGATTETAVKLFQMANGIAVTGEADKNLFGWLNSGEAADLDSVRDAFLEQVRGQNDSARTVIGSVAQRMRGQSFEPDDEDLYAGFAFVQYVCVAAGIPVVAPEDVMERMTEPVNSYSEPETGDVLAIRNADGSVLMAISAGNGSAIYATGQSGYVLESDLRTLASGEVYLWNMKAVEG